MSCSGPCKVFKDQKRHIEQEFKTKYTKIIYSVTSWIIAFKCWVFFSNTGQNVWKLKENSSVLQTSKNDQRNISYNPTKLWNNAVRNTIKLMLHNWYRIWRGCCVTAGSVYKRSAPPDNQRRSALQSWPVHVMLIRAAPMTSKTFWYLRFKILLQSHLLPREIRWSGAEFPSDTVILTISCSLWRAVILKPRCACLRLEECVMQPEFKISS